LEKSPQDRVRVFISKQIRKREFGRSISAADLAVIARTARVSLGTPISGKGLPDGTRLIKAYGTSATGPKGVVYLLVVEEQDLFLLFYRDKNDALGRNASMANPSFRSALEKHLSLLNEDILSENIETLPINPTP
jgi:hypothetical protein